MIELHPLTGIGEIAVGDDLGATLARALEQVALRPRTNDVLVVTQKIVSKAEGRLVKLGDVSPSAEAHELAARTHKDARLVELVLRESNAVVRAAPHVLITRTKHGLVMANAGIDRSNIGPQREDYALLLPVDPDASASTLARALAHRFGVASAVLISDSFGRPWRNGVVNVAIGAHGFPSLVDRRGEVDRDGRKLEVTQVALADMAASAAGLVMGEGAEGVPAVLVRGFAFEAPDTPAAALVRPLSEDLFQ